MVEKLTSISLATAKVDIPAVSMQIMGTQAYCILQEGQGCDIEANCLLCICVCVNHYKLIMSVYTTL